MKKLLLALSLFGLGQVYGISIEEIKEAFYQHQKEFMSEAQYKQFIDPYLQQAYRDLEMFRHTVDGSTKFAESYIKVLAEYNAHLFDIIANNRTSFINTSSGTVNIKPDRAPGDLRWVMGFYFGDFSKDKKKREGFVDFYPKSEKTRNEFDKTKKIFEQAAKEYYKKLGLMKRFSFWARRALDTIVSAPFEGLSWLTTRK